MPLTNYITPVLFIGILLLFHERIFKDKAILDHVKFSYECFDRVITNCIVKALQYPKGFSRYLFDHFHEVSSEAIKLRTARIHEQMEQLAKENNIEVKKIEIGTNLLEIAKSEMEKRRPLPENEDFIVAIFKQLDYGNTWNYSAKEKSLQRKIRRTYHYTVYHFDREFGLGSHTLNTYLPNNVRGYFNQHNWIVQQLKKRDSFHDIKMYYNSFQDIGSIDPEKFQALCNSMTYIDVWRYDWKWIRRLWPELNDLHYDIYINEAEFCSNIAFKQKSFLNKFYINHTLSAYEMSQPDNLSFVFKRRIDKRYKNAFKTNLKIVETKPCLRLKYKSQQYKEYLKDKVLRSESTTNNPNDLGIRKADINGIRETCRDINERALSIQEPVDPEWVGQDLDHNPFERAKVGGMWIPGLKINNEKMASIMRGLSKSNIIGMKMRDLTEFVNLDLGRPSEDSYSLSQISYTVRKLRGHGLAEKIKGKNLYCLTPAGHGFVRMYLQVIEKVILPFTRNIIKLSKEPRYFRKEYQPADTKSDYLSNLNEIYNEIQNNIDNLFNHLDIVNSTNQAI